MYVYIYVCVCAECVCCKIVILSGFRLEDCGGGFRSLCSRGFVGAMMIQEVGASHEREWERGGIDAHRGVGVCI